MMELLSSVGLDADDLLGKCERVIVKNRLRETGSRGETKTVVIKDETKNIDRTRTSGETGHTTQNG